MAARLPALFRNAQHDVSVDVISFSATIPACEKGGQWQHTLSLLEVIRRAGISSNVVIFNASIYR